MSVASCASDDEASNDRRSVAVPAEDAGEAAADFPFEPVPPRVYVAKVKNLLTGLPPTSEELAAVVANPDTLKGFIDGWIATPQGQEKLLGFLARAFQQTQFLLTDFADFIGDRLPGLPPTEALLAGNLRESFARSILSSMNEGRPFTDAVTTKTYVMTPALMSLLALVDARRFDDQGRLSDKWSVETAGLNGFRIQNTTPVPFEQSIDPASPNYMAFYTPGSLGTGCAQMVYPASSGNSLVLANFLFGLIIAPTTVAPCNVNAVPAPSPVVPSDYTTWKAVTIRKPAPGEKPTRFWDLPKLRSTSELVLDIPRVGFFSTLAFQANWPTNSSNLARVTVNQTLIVALGASFDPEDKNAPFGESGLDTQHADPSTPCYGCHKLLDPMRGYFRKNLTLNYHEQLDPKETVAAPSFSFGGVTAAGNSLDDLASTLANHPSLPTAWAQKLCFYADSAACSADDPEFLRVVAAFKDRMDFRILMRELFASPLVTGAARTKTFKDREVVVSVSRQDHLCRALANRLGIDACNATPTATTLSTNLPRDSYSRGGERPVLNSDVSLFYRTGVENLCRAVADVVIDVPAPKTGRYTSQDKDAAITDFVRNVMALAEGDPRAPAARDILASHYDEAVKTGAKPVDALKSTFVLACTSPTAVSIGL